MPKIALSSNYKILRSAPVVINFGVPLGFDVIKRGAREDGEKQEENVSVVVRKWSLFLHFCLVSRIYRVRNRKGVLLSVFSNWYAPHRVITTTLSSIGTLAVY